MLLPRRIDWLAEAFAKWTKGSSYLLSALVGVVPGIPMLSGVVVPGFFHHQNLQNIPHNGNQPAEIMQEIQQKRPYYLSLSRRCRK
jgi:hypothetical protein